MTYTPKPGDRVTSPLLVGEWVFNHRYTRGSSSPGCIVTRDDAIAEVPIGTLTPVAPPLPTEPPVGAVVWDGERYWQRSTGSWSSARSAFGVWRDVKDWSQIAADAVPVVPVNKVADWLRNYFATPGPIAGEFLAEFGGFDA